MSDLTGRDLWRMATFDVLAPAGAVFGLVLIGVTLHWPWWWVSACSVLILLIVEAVAVNFWLQHRDSVTVGTDDDRPWLRLAVVGVCTAVLVTGLGFEYQKWYSKDRVIDRDSSQVVTLAVAMAEATATVNPSNPSESIEKAAGMMLPDKVDAFDQAIGRNTRTLAEQGISRQSETLAAGLEAIGPAMARVAVVLRSTQTAPEQPAKSILRPLWITMVKRDGRWLVADVGPIFPH